MNCPRSGMERYISKRIIIYTSCKRLQALYISWRALLEFLFAELQLCMQTCRRFPIHSPLTPPPFSLSRRDLQGNNVPITNGDSSQTACMERFSKVAPRLAPPVKFSALRWRYHHIKCSAEEGPELAAEPTKNPRSENARLFCPPWGGSGRLGPRGLD